MILCVRRLQPAAHGTGIQNFVGSAVFTDFQRSGPFMRRRTDVLQNHRSGPGSRVCSETFGPELKNREPLKEPNKSLRNGPSAVLRPPEAPRTGSEGSGRVVLDFKLPTLKSFVPLPATLHLKSHLTAVQLGSAETQSVPSPVGLAPMTSSRMRNIFPQHDAATTVFHRVYAVLLVFWAIKL